MKALCLFEPSETASTTGTKQLCTTELGNLATLLLEPQILQVDWLTPVGVF
jgi:hypothetical protein